MTKIIAFAGRKQSGKTTCSEYVKDLYNSATYGKLFDNVKTTYLAKIYNFADPLKQDICMNILGLTYDQCYGTDEDKNQYTEIIWGNKKLTAREVMQFIGTDIFRKMKTDVWAGATIKKITKENPGLGIIADCRFPNEVEVVKSAGGLAIKLMRNPYNSNHESEQALDKNEYDHNFFDLVIENETLSIQDQNSVILDFLINKGVLS